MLKYWRNQYWTNNIKQAGILSLLVLVFSLEINAKEKSYPPGIFGSLKELIDIEQKAYIKKNQVLLKNPRTLQDLQSATDLRLEMDYLNSIFLHSSNKYMSFATESKCSFYNLLNTQLLKTAEGEIRNVFINYKNAQGNRESSIISKQDFLKKVVPGKCDKVMDAQTYFKGKNFSKTFNDIKNPSFATMNSCLQFHEDFKLDSKSPHFCDIYEKIKNLNIMKTHLIRLKRSDKVEKKILKDQIAFAEQLKKKITTKQYGIIGPLCENIHNPQKYCKEIFHSSFWDKIVIGERNSSYMSETCKEMLKKNSITRQDLTTCAEGLNKNPEICPYSNLNFPSLVPKPNCDAIGDALNYSRIFSLYKDCPARMGNESVSNIGRLLRHINEDKGSKADLCFSDTSHAFAKFNLDGDNEKAWGNFLCYFDKIENKDICKPVVIGSNLESNLDLGKVLVGVMSRLEGLSSDTKCNVIPKDSYNPAILSYKTGCYILIDSSCLGTNCQIIAYNQEKELKGFTLKSHFDFDYITNDFSRNNFSQLAILERHLEKKNKEMKNTTYIKNNLNQYPESIIHGIGCAEDILPHFFRKTTFNQCTPLPFIIDGMIESEGLFTFIVRTAIDDIHSPRKISWNYLYNGVKNYQSIHPLNKWSLNATY